jgi:beta-ring hydroxylase
MLAPTAQVPLLRWLVPRQRRCTEAMQIVNTTLDQLISKCKRLVRSTRLGMVAAHR